VLVDDLREIHLGRRNINDQHVLCERDDARARFVIVSDELILLRIHRKKTACNFYQGALACFHCADEVTSGVMVEKLAMNGVNLVSGSKDHWPRRLRKFGCEFMFAL
jgi:hypothetical protein